MCRNVRATISYRILYLLPFSIFLSVFVSCVQPRSDIRFDKALENVDTQISAGKTKKALTLLVKMRRDASTCSQWLSLVKRERELNNYQQAADTLNTALTAMPANETLAALQIDTLLNMNNPAAACVYTSSLLHTAYAALAAYAELCNSDTTPTSGMNPEYWLKAYDAVPNPIFARNAAVMYAVQGDLASACTIAKKQTDVLASVRQSPDSDFSPQKNHYFTALLLYDAGFPDLVHTYITDPGGTTSGVADEMLVADAFFQQDDITNARKIWKMICSAYPESSPIPYYNLAVTSTDIADEKQFLEDSLTVSPAYYPAVVRFARRADTLFSHSTITPDAADQPLVGFTRMEAVQRIKQTTVTIEQVQTILSNALTASSDGSMDDSPKDIRLLIEDMRFKNQLHPDAIQESGRIWELIEKYPRNEVLHRYALWFFALTQNYDACFSINHLSTVPPDIFYVALEKAYAGNLTEAEADFAQVSEDPQVSWCALANLACIHRSQHSYSQAIGEFSRAAGMISNTRIQSQLHYELGRILADLKSYGQAMVSLNHALDLDPSNYGASVLLEELEETK